MERMEKEVHILHEYKPIIYLTGDREYEAVANYMWNRHHHDIDTGKYDIMAARGFVTFPDFSRHFFVLLTGKVDILRFW